MNPKLLSANTPNPKRRDKTFHGHEFMRIIALVRPFWKLLMLGLLATVAFASLHTISISAAFPVFKILLEEEGLKGWVDRTIAGSRLGLQFAPLTDRDTRVLEITEVTGEGDLCPDPECTAKSLQGVKVQPALVLVHDLA